MNVNWGALGQAQVAYYQAQVQAYAAKVEMFKRFAESSDPWERCQVMRYGDCQVTLNEYLLEGWEIDVDGIYAIQLKRRV